MRYHSPEYTAYMQSPAWQARRRAALNAAGWCCEQCGMPRELVRLQVHHRTYERLGAELPSDLQVLCRPCHERADERRRAELVRWRLDGELNRWVRDRLGPEWELFADSAWLQTLYKAERGMRELERMLRKLFGSEPE
jgi:5-methylcytosine-specific restriction endonuclease McrA